MALNDPIRVKALAPNLERLLDYAHKFGATQADAIATYGRSLSVTIRGGQLEDVDNSENRDIGLRVFVGRRQACVSSSDMSSRSMQALAERAVAMAKYAPEDAYADLAPSELLCQRAKNLDLYDDTPMSPAELKSRALELEQAALSVPGILQAEGANAGWAQSAVYFKTSHGFGKGWRSSRHTLSVSTIAEQDGAMERDYDMDGARFLSELKGAQDIGQLAAKRTLARLGGRQLSSGTMPVLFDQRISASILAAFLSAISGPAIARGISFLKDKMNQPLFAANIDIIDDPFMRRGHGSRPWDGEGICGRKQYLIKDGVLQNWLLNTSTARQLGLTTTGHAVRGIGSPPGVGATNAYIKAGERSPHELISDMGEGLWVTEMFGPSLNSNTGDYSVGVSGFKIEGGERTHPVHEITIAGNILDMFKTLVPANDLIFDEAVSAPSLLIQGLTIAGQ